MGFGTRTRRMLAQNNPAPLFFMATSVATQGVTNTALNIANDTNAHEYTLPWPGAIVGISAALENARTAGTLTIKPSVNGATSATLSIVANAATPQYPYANQNPGIDKFVAGNRISCLITSTGDWDAGIAPSIQVIVWVLKT